MSKPKRKPVDPATRMRFIREKKCFNPDHEKEIASLRDEIAKRAQAMAEGHATIESLNERMKKMVDQDLSEEAAKTARSEGYHEGLAEKEAELKREKICLDPFHRGVGGKPPIPLSLMEVMALFYRLEGGRMMSNQAKILVFLPEGMSLPDRNGQLEQAIGAVMRKMKNEP